MLAGSSGCEPENRGVIALSFNSPALRPYDQSLDSSVFATWESITRCHDVASEMEEKTGHWHHHHLKCYDASNVAFGIVARMRFVSTWASRTGKQDNYA